MFSTRTEIMLFSAAVILSLDLLLTLHFIHSFVHQWLYSPLLGRGLFFSSAIFSTWTVELLGRVISPSQGCYLHRATQTQNKRIYKHPCLQWDPNPRSQRSSERRPCLRPRSHCEQHFSVCRITKPYENNGSTAACILNLCNRWR
jgi:hypothetical protein